MVTALVIPLLPKSPTLDIAALETKLSTHQSLEDIPNSTHDTLLHPFYVKANVLSELLLSSHVPGNKSSTHELLGTF